MGLGVGGSIAGDYEGEENDEACDNVVDIIGAFFFDIAVVVVVFVNCDGAYDSCEKGEGGRF